MYIDYFIPMKFHQILLSGSKGEVENASANQRSGEPSFRFQFSVRLQNTNLAEDIEFLLPVKFLKFC